MIKWSGIAGTESFERPLHGRMRTSKLSRHPSMHLQDSDPNEGMNQCRYHVIRLDRDSGIPSPSGETKAPLRVNLSPQTCNKLHGSLPLASSECISHIFHSTGKTSLLMECDVLKRARSSVSSDTKT